MDHVMFFYIIKIEFTLKKNMYMYNIKKYFILYRQH